MIGSIKLPGSPNSPLGIGFNSAASANAARIGFRSPYYGALKVTTTISEGQGPAVESSKAILSDNPDYPIKTLPIPINGGIFIIFKETGVNSGFIPSILPTASFGTSDVIGQMSLRISNTQVAFQFTDSRPGFEQNIFANNTEFPIYSPGCEHGLLATWETDGLLKRINVYYNGILLGKSAFAIAGSFPTTFYDICFGGTRNREVIAGADAPALIKIGVAGVLNTIITETEGRIISNPRLGPYNIPDIQSRCQNLWEFNKHIAAPGWPTPTAAYTPDSVGTAHLGTGDEIPLNNIYTLY